VESFVMSLRILKMLQERIRNIRAGYPSNRDTSDIVDFAVDSRSAAIGQLSWPNEGPVQS
jgi:hypothetical protein